MAKEKTEAMIVKSIKSETGLRVNVTLCEPESLPRSEGKSVRVIDERNFEWGEKYGSKTNICIYRKQRRKNEKS